ncbi:MAG: tRNA 2-thiouridine(34) synthase MnmA [Candidatus Pacearchaeota archaeon]
MSSKKMLKNNKKVLVAMSGGVDSSVAAYLLKKQGYEVIGAFMHSFNLDGCEQQDILDAQLVANQLKIPFYVFDFEKEYKKKVIDYILEEYQKGYTPNPDVMCNKEIKFGLFLEKAKQLKIPYIATGHYVKLKKKKYKNKFIYSLYQAKDLNKDQSYFLWTLNSKQLKHCLFPLGDYLKQEVRSIAQKIGLINALKKDSQGICFLGKISLRDFLKKYLKTKRGLVVNLKGEKIGEHEGVWFYTIGQRHLKLLKYYPRKLGPQQLKPLYVVEKDIKNNILIVAEDENDKNLFKKEIIVTQLNFVNPLFKEKINLKNKIKVFVRVRYRQNLNPAYLLKEKNKKYKILFLKPVKFVAPGQSAVFYSSLKELIGGGIIIN